MEFSPDGRLFVAEKSGSLRIIQNGHWTALQLNNTNFRVRITSGASSTTRDFSLDVVGLRVTVQ